MKLSEKSETLLERYLLAVERRLPWTGRKELIAEIRANLLDTLEDHYAPDEVLSEEMLETELRKFGAPATVAASYFETDALIGPQHNIIFRLVVQYLVPIVVGAVFFAGVLSFALSGGKSPFWSIWELFGNAWNVGVSIIGTAAVVLMILTRFFPQVNNEAFAQELLDDKRKEWKVSDLPEIVRETDKVHVWEPVFGIVLGFIGLIFWLFLFKDWGGMWWRADEQWHMVPIFTQAFTQFIPWIAINTGLDIVLNMILAIQGKRSIIARIVEIIIKVSEISLIGFMLRAGKLLALDAQQAVASGFPAEAVSSIQMLLDNNFVRWFLIFLLVVLSLDLLKKLVELVERLLQG